MTTRAIYQDRAFAGEADLQGVCDLLNASDAADHLDDNYEVADLRREFASPDLDPARDLHVWENAAGQMVGFGQLWIRTDNGVVDGYLYFRVHPDDRPDALVDGILAWGSARLREVAREHGGLPIKMGSSAREHADYYRRALEARGFPIVRYFFRMQRPLDQPIPEPQFPAGFILRHVVSDEDAERWVEMFNQSFIDHWNHHPETVESHRHELASPHYQAERDLIAVAPDGTFAGFCFCWIDPEDNARNGRNEGWISMLGTRRGFRQIGLGRAMLLAGLQRLKADGTDVAVLGVDADNPTGALRLYESVGFTTVYTTMAYAKELES